MNVVTGSFGFIGRHITQRLLARGQTVLTITTHPDKPNPFGSEVEALPYAFDYPKELEASLRGADVLYNTYWIRFEYGEMTYARALYNTATLFECARKAGVKRIVHIGVTGSSESSPLPYYRSKAAQERLLREAGVPYGIVRPTLVFGEGDILVNNIARLMRVFPVFPIFGDGRYEVQPVHVDDVADLALICTQAPGSGMVDAIGPERFAFKDFLRLIAENIRPRIFFVPMPPAVAIAFGRVIGRALGDVLLTADELRGLMQGLLTSRQTPIGKIVFSEWLQANREKIGKSYASEIKRHYEWKKTG
ncbi:MAG TPA: NAD-dependent epimerase/dehydratase family protein [Anaerolineales bacterium]